MFVFLLQIVEALRGGLEVRVQIIVVDEGLLRCYIHHHAIHDVESFDDDLWVNESARSFSIEVSASKIDHSRFAANL